MKTNLLIATILMAGTAMAQAVIPDGTGIRVLLEEDLSSETGRVGQIVSLHVAQDVYVGNAVVIAAGARATGSIVKLEKRRSFGRGGELDFSIERVQLVDGSWLNVRYTQQQRQGNHLTDGVVAAARAVAFRPPVAICVFRSDLDKGVSKGRTFGVFSAETAYVDMPIAELQRP
jgi:hypothetical protein